MTVRTETGVFSLRVEDGGWFFQKKGEEEVLDVASEEMRKYAVDTSKCASKPYMAADTKYLCLRSETGVLSRASESMAEIMGDFSDLSGVDCRTPLPGFDRKIWRGDKCPDEVEEEEPDLTQEQLSINPLMQSMRDALQDLEGPIEEKATGWGKFTQEDLQEVEMEAEITLKLRSISMGEARAEGTEPPLRDPPAANGAESGDLEGEDVPMPDSTPAKERKERKPILDMIMPQESWAAWTAMMEGARKATK